VYSASTSAIISGRRSVFSTAAVPDQKQKDHSAMAEKSIYDLYVARKVANGGLGAKKIIEDRRGHVYGDLTVHDLHSVEKYIVKWRCVCKCGNERIVRHSNLIRGSLLHCLDKATHSPAYNKEEIHRRFLSRVDQNAPNGCWVWVGAVNKERNGYGVFSAGRKMLRAHRYSYEYFIGPISDGLMVLHHCDNPACVNPEHFHLGKHKENANDRKIRNRTGWKLAADVVREIKEKLSVGNVPGLQTALATEYGVTPSLINNIYNDRAWTHVPWPMWFKK
jgi:hypothetical protein